MRTFISLLVYGIYSISGINAQTTLTLSVLKDAAIGYHDGASTAGNNYGGAQQNAAFCIPATASVGGLNVNRALIDFDLTLIPTGAIVMSAFLNLYSLNPLGVYPGHTGSANASFLERITQSWVEFAVTWNTQPTSTALNQVVLPTATTSTQNYLNINVTTLVNDMRNNPSTSFGFKLRMVNQAPTNILAFVSNDHNNLALRPTLVVTYSMCSPATLSVSPTQSMCSGNQVNLQASGSGTNVLWYSSSTSTTPIASGSVYSTGVLTATGVPQVYSYYALAQGCALNPLVPVSVLVNPLPNITPVSSPSAVCVGGSITLTGSGAQTYTWTQNQVVIGNSNVMTIVPPTSSTFVLTGKDANNCVGSSSLIVNVLIPNINAASSHSSVCAGGSITLTGSGAQTYTWTRNQVVIGTSSLMTIVPLTSSTFVLTGKDANNCVGSSTLAVNVNTPNIKAVSSNSSVCLGASIILTGTGALTYTWTRNQSVIGTSSIITFIPPTTSTIILNGKDANNCVGNSTVTVNVLECIGIEESSIFGQTFAIYPNPINDHVTLNFTENVRAGDYVIITDLSGKVLQNHTLSDEAGKKATLKIDLEEGMYFCTLVSEGNSIFSRKIIVRR